MAANRLTGWPAWLAGALMLPASVVPIAWLEAQPRNGNEVAAIFAPWTTGEDALARVVAAGGLPVRPGVLGSILVVFSARPGLVDRLYAAGAWAVVDPVAFGGCLIRTAGAT
jgi:hypothetical protein